MQVFPFFKDQRESRLGCDLARGWQLYRHLGFSAIFIDNRFSVAYTHTPTHPPKEEEKFVSWARSGTEGRLLSVETRQLRPVPPFLNGCCGWLSLYLSIITLAGTGVRDLQLTVYSNKIVDFQQRYSSYFFESGKGGGNPNSFLPEGTS